MAGVEKDPGNPRDEVDLVPVLRGTGKLAPRALYWHWPHYIIPGAKPATAIRDGYFKLLEFLEDNHLELYNLAEDIGERKDLARKLPQKVEEFRSRLHRWRRDVGASRMKPNPEYKPQVRVRSDVWPLPK
jgi:arylsulfatase A-like enzyme